MVDDLSTIPGCLGYFGSPLPPNICISCDARDLCLKVANDAVFSQLVKITVELKGMRKKLEAIAR
ncbi:MAG: hypothetical protein QXU75_08310 [Candidatus Methanomethylicaceae archaeon]